MRKANELKLVLYLAVAIYFWTLVEMKIRAIGLAAFLLTAACIVFCVIAGVYALRSIGRTIETKTQPPPTPLPKIRVTEDEISKMDPVNQAFMREWIKNSKRSPH